MKPATADRIIKAGKPVLLKSRYGETFTALIVSRDRWNVRTSDGGVFDRGDLELVDEKVSK